MAYRRMPYGLHNAQALFQRVVDTEVALARLDRCAAAFIDDVLIWYDSPEQHRHAVPRKRAASRPVLKMSCLGPLFY